MVNVTGVVTDTPVAPLAGLVETTLNDPLPYPVVPVVNELLKVVTELPSVSLKPPTDTLCNLETARGALGTNVSVTPSLARLTVPATGLPPDGVTVMELLVTVVGSMSSLITATTCVLTGTTVWLSAGPIAVTVVGFVSEAEPVTKPLL